MRRILDTIYGAALVAACGAMVAIAALVAVQVAGRLIDRVALALGAAPVGISIPSLAEIGGFLFVGAATLALPATLRAGGHIRVTLLTGALPGRLGRAVAGLVLLAGLVLAGFATWHAGVQAWDSWAFNTLSYGMVRVPLWIPQGVMTLGFALLALALADDLVAHLRGDAAPSLAQGQGGH